MKATLSGAVGAALIAVFALVRPAAAADAGDAVPLTMRETTKECIPQEELRKIAVHRCELLDAVITNVQFTDLCGAKGSAPMYSTILYDCRPARSLR